MAVQFVTYTNVEQTNIKVEHDDATPDWFMPWPSETWHGPLLQAWIDDGNMIAAYPNALSDAITNKEAELNAEYSKRAELLGYDVSMGESAVLKDIYVAGGGSDPNLDKLFTNYDAAVAASIVIAAFVQVSLVNAYNVETEPSWSP